MLICNLEHVGRGESHAHDPPVLTCDLVFEFMSTNCLEWILQLAPSVSFGQIHLENKIKIETYTKDSISKSVYK